MDQQAVNMREGSPPPCGWYGTAEAFLDSSEDDWLASLDAHHRRCTLASPSRSQLAAWDQSREALATGLYETIESDPAFQQAGLIFEYELPRERGRRPDVLLFLGSDLFVLEFKGEPIPQAAHRDQVAAYGRDLGNYHSACRDLAVRPILVVTSSSSLEETDNGVVTVSPDRLANALLSLRTRPPAHTPNLGTWLQGDYAPLPSLVAAARTIFQHEPLPQIRRAQSAGIPQVVAELELIAQQARARGERHFALVTGVPGAGKTLVGLQFVYSDHFSNTTGARSAIFLSGNGPLVKVLQHALKSSVFVQDVHGFLKQYGGNTGRLPEEHIWVYDEAQRAWDEERVHDKRGHSTSEPEDFLKIGERMNSWAMLVGLIGEGQEIHLGEEAGLRQWDAALAKMGSPWIAHCPGRIAPIFTHASRIERTDSLDLTSSLRSHLAEDVQRWVHTLLDGHLAGASGLAEMIRQQGFQMYLTSDLEAAKQYARDRYAGEHDKRYGILASSKAKNLPPLGIRNDYAFTKNLREGPWYNDDPDSRYSCCQLTDVATEFSCQGLELDLPIVAWGNDLTWSGQMWASFPQPRSKARDPHTLRLNSYRVLLTRGRDGLVVFVPPTPEMASTMGALSRAGLVILK